MSGWKTHHFGTTLEDVNFFHLDLLGHQNIKTSLHFLAKNHWGRPFFAIFSSVREKLQLTVSLNHPVKDLIGSVSVDCTAIIAVVNAQCHAQIKTMQNLNA